MANTKDPLHDCEHVYRILRDLPALLEYEHLNVNLEVLLLSICWHDTWKATRFPTTIASVSFDQYWDGYGSARIFKKASATAKLEASTTAAVAYAIREHGRIKFFKTRTLEAKALQDLDSLDEWSLVRIEPMKKKYLTNQPNLRLIRLAKYYFDHFMKKQTDKKFWFGWSKTEFKKRKLAYTKEVDRLLATYGHLLK